MKRSFFNSRFGLEAYLVTSDPPGRNSHVESRRDKNGKGNGSRRRRGHRDDGNDDDKRSQKKQVHIRDDDDDDSDDDGDDDKTTTTNTEESRTETETTASVTGGPSTTGSDASSETETDAGTSTSVKPSPETETEASETATETETESEPVKTPETTQTTFISSTITSSEAIPSTISATSTPSDGVSHDDNGPPAPPSDNGPSKPGIAVGSIFGGFVFVAVIFLSFVYYKRWKNKGGKKTTFQPPMSPAPMGENNTSQGGSSFGPQGTFVGPVGRNSLTGQNHSYAPLSGTQPDEPYNRDVEREGRYYASYARQEAAYKSSSDQPSSSSESHPPSSEDPGDRNRAYSFSPNSGSLSQYDPYSPPPSNGQYYTSYDPGHAANGLPALVESSQENLHSNIPAPVQPGPASSNNYGS